MTRKVSEMTEHSAATTGAVADGAPVVIPAPASKSLSHRYLIGAALADGESRVRHTLESADLERRGRRHGAAGRGRRGLARARHGRGAARGPRAPAGVRRGRIRHHLPPAHGRAGGGRGPVPHFRLGPHAPAPHWRAVRQPRAPGRRRDLWRGRRMPALPASGVRACAVPGGRGGARGHGIVEPVFLRPFAGGAPVPLAAHPGAGRAQGRVLALCGADPSVPHGFRHPFPGVHARARGRPLGGALRHGLARPA